MRLQEVEAHGISRHSACEGGKVVSRMLWVPFTPPPMEMFLVLISGRVDKLDKNLFRVGTVDVIDVGPVDILVCLVLVVKGLGTVYPT